MRAHLIAVAGCTALLALGAAACGGSDNDDEPSGGSTPAQGGGLADTVILLRYFEARGRVRRAMSVIKKRTSAHEDTIREYQIGGRGVTLGKPLENFQGVLRGVPVIVYSIAREEWRR